MKLRWRWFDGATLAIDEKLTLLAVPFATFGFMSETNAGKVEPLIGTSLVIAGNHISIRNILAEAIEWFSKCLFSSQV